MTTRDQATGKSERLAVLNSAEQEALYIQPDAAGKAPDHTGRVRGFFSKLRKKLGL